VIGGLKRRMASLNTKNTAIRQKRRKKIWHFLTIIIIESVIFYFFINFLVFKKMNYNVILLILAAILFIMFRRHKKIYASIVESFSQNNIFSILFITLLLLTVPFLFRENSYLLHICIMCGLYLIMALGLNIQLGSTGMVNFAFAAFFGVGAYTSALLAVNFQLSFWIGILVAIIMSAIFGLLIGLLTLKSTGFYYALITMAFQIIFHLLVNNLKFTGGSGGISNIPFPAIGKFSFGSSLKILGVNLPYQTSFYYLILIIALFSIYLARGLYNSRNGLVWNAIREDEIAAKCQGINIARGKLEASAIGAVFGGIAGPIYAHYISYISPESFTFDLSVVLICMVILGGLDNILGVILGAILLTVIPEKFRVFAEYRMLFYGVIIIAVLVFRPEGLIPKGIRQYIPLAYGKGK